MSTFAGLYSIASAHNLPALKAAHVVTIKDNGRSVTILEFLLRLKGHTEDFRVDDGAVFLRQKVWNVSR